MYKKTKGSQRPYIAYLTQHSIKDEMFFKENSTTQPHVKHFIKGNNLSIFYKYWTKLSHKFDYVT